jgi:hypothetical protein
MSAAVLPPSALLPGPESVTDTARGQAPMERLAQQDYGSRCSTARGICSLNRPQPIGSVCRCSDGTRGTTIR